MIDQYDRLIKSTEEKLECKFSELEDTSYKIRKIYGNEFSSYKIKGSNVFSDVAIRAWDKEKTGYWTLAEKCIRRDHDIGNLEYYYKNDEVMLNEISDAEVFFGIIKQILPLEMLWAMEEEKDDDRVFDESEQWAFDFFQAIGEFYLDETQKYETILEQKKKEKKAKVFQKQ